MGRKFVRPEPQPDRSDHLWLARVGSAVLPNDYKCVLCGGVTKAPPPRPTPADWLPERFEPLTEEERSLVPPPHLPAAGALRGGL